MSDTKVSCTYCQEELSGLFVRCIDCEDYICCLMCFSLGAEIGPHKNSHRYKFESTEKKERSESEWNLQEELKLLDAIETFGYGNWEHVASLVGTKTAEEVQKEYENKFLNGPFGDSVWKPARENEPKVTDHSVEDDSPFGEVAISKLPPLDLTPKQAASLGYMPLRDDYEKEYNSNAEQLVSSLVLRDDPDDLDTALKVAQVDMYLHRLRERARKKCLSREYQLPAKFFQKQNEQVRHANKRTKTYDDLEEKFLPFAQFLPAKDFERLLVGLRRESELRRRFKELVTYRLNGITTYAECEQFNKLRLEGELTSGSSNGESSSQCHQLRGGRRQDTEEHNSGDKQSTSGMESPSSSSSSTDTTSIPTDKCRKLLTKSEIQLCKEIQFCPSDYIRAKTILLMNGASEQESPEMDKIQSFLIAANWL